MRVVGASGFARTILGTQYHAGVGLTGLAAATNVAIRVDDVEAHRAEFDSSALNLLDSAHGRRVTSWMAIPIGSTSTNYGVLQVVNSVDPCAWFTQSDEELGASLALRLYLSIELALYLSRMRAAMGQAQMYAEQADMARHNAEQAAAQRQQDLMTVTHQLQGPLIGVMGALSAINDSRLERASRDLLEHARAILEDAAVLTYGVFTTFAQEAGRNSAFSPTSVDAKEEIRSMAKRLQWTNQRADLHFEFREEAGFPLLHVDHQAFACVMYSLIHNALKYADPHSRVVLECSMERIHRRPALKVKSVGQPIAPKEKHEIFGKFRRGSSVEHGRLYSGVGLGLWVARELMRSIGGDLSLELSNAHPRLSVFVTYWPTPIEERQI